MSEIKTKPVMAQHIENPNEFREKSLPGSVSFSPFPDSDGVQYMSWVCPCGCGHQSNLEVGNGFKPPDTPSWQWNGSHEKPTLHPSINRIGHWHGWLRDGVWVSC